MYGNFGRSSLDLYRRMLLAYWDRGKVFHFFKNLYDIYKIIKALIDSLVNWVELDLKLEALDRASIGETTLACPPSFNFLGLGDDDTRDFVYVGTTGNIRPPASAFLHRIWPTRVKFFQCTSGRKLKCLIETKCCLYHGFPNEKWSFRICEALMSEKPERLFAVKRNLDLCFNNLFFTHEVFFPDL